MFCWVLKVVLRPFREVFQGFYRAVTVTGALGFLGALGVSGPSFGASGSQEVMELQGFFFFFLGGGGGAGFRVQGFVYVLGFRV